MRTKAKCSTFWAVYYWLKIIGINSLSLSKSNKLKYSYLSLAYGCFLAASYFYMSYCVWIERPNMYVPGETPLGVIVDFCIFTVNFLEISSMWLSFNFHQKRIKYIVEVFIRTEKMSTLLDIPENYEEHFRKLGIKLSVVSSLYITWGLFNNISTNYHGASIWACYFAWGIVVYNVGTLFIWTLIIVKYKFHRLNHKLRFLLQNDSATTNEIEQANFTIFSNTLNIISQLHRELRDLVHRIMGHYAPLVLYNILLQLFSITVDVHILHRFLKDEGRIKGSNIRYLVSISFWVMVPLIVLVIISNVCDSTAKEANATGSILHTMIVECENFDYTQEAAELKVMSLDLLQNRVRFSILGFFDLDSSLVYNTVATATTYLIIMLQFYG